MPQLLEYNHFESVSQSNLSLGSQVIASFTCDNISRTETLKCRAGPHLGGMKKLKGRGTSHGITAQARYMGASRKGL